MYLSRLALFAAALLASAPLFATDVTMAGGSVSFSTPDHWIGIMETQGDPEVRVFQVPDPSPTARNTLARVSVTVKQVGDLAGFQQYVAQSSTKAQGLPGYQPIRSVSNTGGPDDFLYTAREAGTAMAYVEHYWFRDGHAIQLRCLRPASTQAGVAWQAAFDRGCQAIATRLGK
ncbi:MAG: hypothetical protein KGN77_00040 [Xanthomonadaceae bacterium]|nr:hypothetical protein [Xanthomonadaceae bacterium]MDE1962883.1 hypothetical protein [Xanthomonadaceae bacterium]